MTPNQKKYQLRENFAENRINFLKSDVSYTPYVKGSIEKCEHFEKLKKTLSKDKN